MQRQLPQLLLSSQIEYFGLGVVPLVAKEVDMTYFDAPIEGKHYFRVESADSLPKIIKGCSKERWEEMSYAGHEWYKKNCSPEGSFKTTEKIIKA